MSFFEKSGNISRVNREISKHLEDINRKYTEIGRIVKLQCLDQVQNADVRRLAGEIDGLLAELKKLQEELNVINGIKICPQCNAQIDINVAFCPSCGTKQAVMQQAAPVQQVAPVQQAAPAPMPAPTVPAPAPVPMPEPVTAPAPVAMPEPVVEAAPEAVSEVTEAAPVEEASEPTAPTVEIPAAPSIAPPQMPAPTAIPEPASAPAPGQSVIFCTQCGSKEPAGTRFCSQCGSPM